MSNMFRKIGKNQLMHKLQQMEAALIHADLMLAVLRTYCEPPMELNKRVTAVIKVASERGNVKIEEVQAELERIAAEFKADPNCAFEPFPTAASPTAPALAVVDEPAHAPDAVQSAYEAAVARMDALADTPA